MVTIVFLLRGRWWCLDHLLACPDLRCRLRSVLADLYPVVLWFSVECRALHQVVCTHSNQCLSCNGLAYLSVTMALRWSVNRFDLANQVSSRRIYCFQSCSFLHFSGISVSPSAMPGMPGQHPPSYYPGQPGQGVGFSCSSFSRLWICMEHFSLLHTVFLFLANHILTRTIAAWILAMIQQVWDKSAKMNSKKSWNGTKRSPVAPFLVLCKTRLPVWDNRKADSMPWRSEHSRRIRYGDWNLGHSDLLDQAIENSQRRSM